MNILSGLIYGIQRVIELAVEDTVSIFRPTVGSIHNGFETLETAVDERMIRNIELDQLLLIRPAAAAYSHHALYCLYMSRIGE